MNLPKEWGLGFEFEIRYGLAFSFEIVYGYLCSYMGVSSSLTDIVPLNCIVDTLNRVRTGPGNREKYLNFSLAFSRTGKSLKIVGGAGKSWKCVNSRSRS